MGERTWVLRAVVVVGHVVIARSVEVTIIQIIVIIVYGTGTAGSHFIVHQLRGIPLFVGLCVEDGGC